MTHFLRTHFLRSALVSRLVLGLIAALMLFTSAEPKASAQYYHRRYYRHHGYYHHGYYRHRRWCYYHPRACRY